MAKMYYSKDSDLKNLSNKKVAVIGYGSQGHAHALNLKDSGVDVVVGLYNGSKSWSKAEEDGLKVMEVDEAVKVSEVTIILVPDEVQGRVYTEYVMHNLEEGDSLVFAHGFNVHFNQIKPPEYVDVFMAVSYTHLTLPTKRIV